MVRHPLGKGILIWQLAACAGGDPLRLAIRAREAGFSWVAIKIQDGDRPWNLGLLSGAVSALKSERISVWGWGYLYGADMLRRSIAKREAEATVRLARELGLAGFLIDAEAPYKRPGARAWAATYAAAVRSAAPDLPLGLCTYRWPSLHPELPWREFLSVCDFHAPQLYWQSAHNPAAQLRRSVRELRAIWDLPVIPIGSAYGEHGWEPTVGELNEFHQAALELSLPGIGWWSWQHAERNAAWWTALSTQRWPVAAPPAPAPALSLEERVERLERLARAAGWMP